MAYTAAKSEVDAPRQMKLVYLRGGRARGVGRVPRASDAFARASELRAGCGRFAAACACGGALVGGRLEVVLVDHLRHEQHLRAYMPKTAPVLMKSEGEMPKTILVVEGVECSDDRQKIRAFISKRARRLRTHEALSLADDIFDAAPAAPRPSGSPPRRRRRHPRRRRRRSNGANSADLPDGVLSDHVLTPRVPPTWRASKPRRRGCATSSRVRCPSPCARLEILLPLPRRSGERWPAVLRRAELLAASRDVGTRVSAGYDHAAYIRSDGTVGFISMPDSQLPVVRAVACGGKHTVLLLASGAVVVHDMRMDDTPIIEGAWRTLRPAPAAGEEAVRSVGAGASHTLLVGERGTLWSAAVVDPR